MMENREPNENNGLIMSQKPLFLKFKKINRLFMVHYSSLIVYFLVTLGYMVTWISLLTTGTFTPNLIELYGSFGIPWIIILSIGSLIILIFVGYQIYIYSVFLIKGNRYLKQVKRSEKSGASLYSGIVRYINNFFSFFNRFSKEKMDLAMLVKTFLQFNFLSGWFAIFFITRLLDQLVDAEAFDSTITFLFFMLFLIALTFWAINLITSFKVKREVSKWQKLFPKLEDWAQEIENLPIKNSNSNNSFS